MSGCVSDGASADICQASAVRLTDEQIDLLTDEQVNEILAQNEYLESIGCAQSNQD